MFKKCIICGKDYEVNSGAQKVCGKKCHLEKRRRQYKKIYDNVNDKTQKLVFEDGRYWLKNDYSRVKVNKVTCEICGKEYFLPDYRIRNNKRRICSGKCRGIAFKERYSIERTGEGNPRWKGGRGYVNGSGYMIINKQSEHRTIMEKHIGRKLDDNEIIHHKDLNKLNNKINNLMIFKSLAKHSDFHKKLTVRALEKLKEIDYKSYIEIINGR